MKQDASGSSSSSSGTATVDSNAFHNDLWPLILQQDCIKHDLRTVCSLLCSSRALRAEVSAASAGQLDCCIGTPPCRRAWGSYYFSKDKGNKYHYLTHWICKYGQLLRSLDITMAADDLCTSFPAETAFAAALASAAMAPEPAALNTAADSGVAATSPSSPAPSQPVTLPGSAYPGGASAAVPQQCRLLLQELSVGKATSAALLEHLPSSHLTKLTMGFDCKKQAVAKAAGEALARLTALQELDISSTSTYLSKHELAAVGQLTKLEKLQLPDLTMVGFLCPEWLPAQLQELRLQDLGRWGDGPSEQDDEQDYEDYGEQNDEVYHEQDDDCRLQLGQLTALTRLQVGWEMPDMTDLLLWHGDVLPPNLVVLDAQLGSLQPVLKLQHLQQLKLTLPPPIKGAVDLLQLTVLQSLTDLRLDYVKEYADVDGSCWPVLPVKHLAFGSGETSTLQALAQLPDLTSLKLGGFLHREPCEIETGYGALAKALQQLTALQELIWKDVYANSDDLCLWDAEFDMGTDGGNSSSSSSDAMVMHLSPGWVMLRAVATHPLRSVTFIGTPLEEIPGNGQTSPIMLLQAATGLTHLKLCRCGVQDADVILLAQHLTVLQHLSVNWNDDVSSAVLPAVCSSLTQLTDLDLSRTAISDDHLHCLSGLQRLRVLNLGRTCVTNDGVLQLSCLSQLSRLWVSGGHNSAGVVSPEAGRERLRCLLPYCDCW